MYLYIYIVDYKNICLFTCFYTYIYIYIYFWSFYNHLKCMSNYIQIKQRLQYPSFIFQLNMCLSKRPRALITPHARSIQDILALHQPPISHTPCRQSPVPPNVWTDSPQTALFGTGGLLGGVEPGKVWWNFNLRVEGWRTPPEVPNRLPESMDGWKVRSGLPLFGFGNFSG